MRKVLNLVVALSLLVVLAGCSNNDKEENRTLVVSTWGLSEDVLEEDVYGPFEEKFNCDVILETDTTAARYTKLSTNPDSNIDVIELSQSAAANGYAEGLFEKMGSSISG